MGSTISAIIRIRNLTYSNITQISAYDFDYFDFGSCRPDKAFSGKSIASKSCIEKTIDFSTISTNCPITIKLIYDNNSEDIFRLHLKSFLENGVDHLKQIEQTHRIHLMKTGPRVVEIIVENTEKQIENYKAERLITDGCKLMDLGKFNEASIKFLDASQKANAEDTIKRLQKSLKQLRKIKKEHDDEQKAKNLNNAGLSLLKSSYFFESVEKFKEALHFAKTPETHNLIEDNLRIAEDARNNEQAEQIYKEGLTFLENSNLDDALLSFDRAFKIANEPDLIREIKLSKSDCLKKQAEEILDEAWVLDGLNAQSAIYYFAKSKFLFEEANTLHSRFEFEDKILMIECKIEGEKLFNLGLQVKNSNEAVNFFKQSLQKFREGRIKSSEFQKSVEKVGKCLENLISET